MKKMSRYTLVKKMRRYTSKDEQVHLGHDVPAHLLREHQRDGNPRRHGVLALPPTMPHMPPRLGRRERYSLSFSSDLTPEWAGESDASALRALEAALLW